MLSLSSSCAFSFYIISFAAVAPNITASRHLFGVYEGANATLECIVEAYPLATNHWMKGSTLLQTVTNSGGSDVASTSINITGAGSNDGTWRLTEATKMGYNGVVHNNEDEVISRR